MVDIETMGTGPNAAIVQIGACYFDRLRGVDRTERYLLRVNVSLEDAVQSGFDVSGETVNWWINQVRDGNPADWLGSHLMTIREAMTLFLNYAGDADCIWSHSTFDFVILENAARKLGLKPMSYRKARDIRTLTDLAYLKPDTASKPHDALKDALLQVEYCVECFKRLQEDI
jgi:exodeoxyribonuclease VIII